RLFYTNGGTGVLNQNIAAGTQKPPTFLQITDGLSNTLLFATNYQYCGGTKTDWLDPQGLAATFGSNDSPWQQKPAPADCMADRRAVSLTADYLYVVFCDRNTRNLHKSLSPAVWAAMHTPGAAAHGVFEPPIDLGD